MADEIKTAEKKPNNIVMLRNNNMEAWLKLEKPEDGLEYTYSDIEKILSANGVVFGLNSSRINAMIKKGIYDREVLVATGKNPEEGQDGYFEFIFDVEKNTKPAIRALRNEITHAMRLKSPCAAAGIEKIDWERGT